MVEVECQFTKQMGRSEMLEWNRNVLDELNYHTHTTVVRHRW